MLLIKSPLREYQLTLSSAGGNKLEGGHFYPGQQQGHSVDFSIVSYDKATRQKMVDDQKKALTSSPARHRMQAPLSRVQADSRHIFR